MGPGSQGVGSDDSAAASPSGNRPEDGGNRGPMGKSGTGVRGMIASKIDLQDIFKDSYSCTAVIIHGQSIPKQGALKTAGFCLRRKS